MNVRRTCIGKQIRDLIVERILDGRYPPGTHLKEMVLAKEFDVSQGPVREALRELETLGMVDSEPYRGTRVHAADTQQLHEAYELRVLLEERAAQLASPCSEETLTALQREFEQMQQAVAREDYAAYAVAATTFHRTLMVAAGNSTFVRVWDSQQWEVRARIAAQRLRDRGISFDVFLTGHEALLRSLRAGDGQAAGRHIRDLMSRVLRGIDPAQDRAGHANPIAKSA